MGRRTRLRSRGRAQGRKRPKGWHRFDEATRFRKAMAALRGQGAKR